MMYSLITCLLFCCVQTQTALPGGQLEELLQNQTDSTTTAKEGLMITGGRHTTRSVELWTPGPGSTPLSCYLPHMNRGRQSHTLTGSGLACGGYGGGDARTDVSDKYLVFNL